jgi:hypothetical protein
MSAVQSYVNAATCSSAARALRLYATLPVELKSVHRGELSRADGSSSCRRLLVERLPAAIRSAS